MDKLPPEFRTYYDQKMNTFTSNLTVINKENKVQDKIAQISESNEKIYQDSISKLKWNVINSLNWLIRKNQKLQASLIPSERI